MHTPPFVTDEVPVDGTLAGRYTVSLSTAKGVITLTRNDCRRILPAVAHLAEHGESLDDEDEEIVSG